MAGASSSNLPLSESLDVQGEVIPPRNLKQPVRAVNYDAYEGMLVGECREGGSAVEVKAQSGWIAFRDVEFGEGASSMKLRAASARAASVEIRLRSPVGSLVGRSELEGSGAQEWNDFIIELNGMSGRQDVYIIVNGSASLSTVQFL
ncbi:Endo-1,4-beta-xylanase Z precursor [compost metagenome]